MSETRIEKIVVNMGAGADPERLKKSEQVLKSITGMKPVRTKSQHRIPDWGLRLGLEIGLKVTLRGEKAMEFLKKTLAAKENKLSEKCFDKEGNFGFGIKEHIDLPGIKYDPKLGIVGMDILVALKKRGYRVKYRKINQTKVGRKHRVTKEDAITFVKELGVEVA
jgi:large subunit ribosomal protein L5